jgi:hypothetical protein
MVSLYTEGFPEHTCSRKEVTEARGGFMGRCSSAVWVIILIASLSLLAACGSSSSSNTPKPPPVPASVTLSPGSHSSIDIGSLLNFSATARNSAGTSISGLTISFTSSNPDVLTIANSGIACAGKWDSLSNPVVCRPGPSGTAQVIATASGVSSPPTTVYVHQHIDHIEITAIGTPPKSCFSQDQTWTYEAAVFANIGTDLIDITPTVGPLNWTSVNFAVASLNTTASDLLANQVRATAVAPGITQLFTSVTGVNSNPIVFKTCLIKSIDLVVQNEGTTTLSVTSGTSKTIEATAFDELDHKLTKPPLTWSSSNVAVVSVPSGAPEKTTASISAVAAGGATVIASCTPPSCNSGVFPSLPIYPNQVISVNVTAKTAAAPSAWVTSTQCETGKGGPFFNCGTVIAQITGTDAKIGSNVFLPHPPNSLLFTPQGGRAFAGSRNGLMIVDPAATSGATAQVVSSVTGTVLAVSRDGSRVVVSDPNPLIGGPPRVFIFNQSSSAAPVVLQVPNAVAAAFSPDGLKTYIVSNASLYVFSTVDAQKGPIALAPITAATSIAFSQYGAFAYIAGAPQNVTPAVTCSNNVLAGASTPGIPLSLTAIPDGTHLVALDPPSIDIFAQENVAIDGCTSTVNLTRESVTNLGLGNFTPIAMLVSSDGAKAYVVAQNLSSILVFDIVGKTTGAIPLTDNAIPLSASLTTDGTHIFVATQCTNIDPDTNKCTVPTLHLIDTVIGSDIQQITFENSFCTNLDNKTLFCTPNLVAVKP